MNRDSWELVCNCSVAMKVSRRRRALGGCRGSGQSLLPWWFPEPGGSTRRPRVVHAPGTALRASVGPAQTVAMWKGVCRVLFFCYPGGFG